ncbi:ribosome-releasing factor 2, mitochondrial [Cephus cinctus]|uniref:Elongation factor G2 n=1 Tax=Cephus cinctus TaxID=211228 RepID=A0AAJ7FCS8_CEPCN|nr:ribosome-releasing factor 2, mitochondrial [Cephus cinctus]
MLRRNLINTSRYKFHKRTLHNDIKIDKMKEEKHNLKKIRNIGILAHIDAGKTTTTERMLYYSGTIGNMGEVHHGNTVTDYMEQERERGITITSAAVTFCWKDHRFNLIDTPGHIDFTMGVEQTLNVLDGVIVVLDGSAGVEAQTVTVWKQADRYNIPRIVFVNKMDRLDGNFDMSLASIESKLETVTLPIQLPIKEKTGLVGIIDIITLERIIFDSKSQGRKMTKTKLTESEDGHLWEIANEKRRILTDKLSGLDDELANIIIKQESLDAVPSQILVDAIHKSTVNRKGVPVLLGSAYKNIGVQPLMDSVILYLPSPDENKYTKEYECFENNLSARAFKIIHDKQRGPVTFLRIYTGKFTKSQRIYNVQRERSEQSSKLYVVYADDYEEIEEIKCGNIAAVAGLKSTVTGDLITNNASSASRARKNMENRKKATPKEIENLFSTGTRIPDPVFFCSIEPPSLAYQNALDAALQQLEREDPSLRVSQDEETGQTVLAGMGELHIDIIKERIRTEYKIDVDLGPLQIAYKETIQVEAKDTHVSNHKIGNSSHSVTVTMSLIPFYEGKENLLLDRSHESASNIDNIHPRVMQAVRHGVQAAILHGPKLGCPVVNMGIKLHWLEVGRGTSDTMITAAVSQCIRKLMQAGESILMEPIMQLEVVSPDEYVSSILNDLTRRRAQIQRIDVRGQNKVLETLTPLSELLGYATALRIISSGTAVFSLEFDHYKAMSSMEEQQAIKRVTGF